MSGLLPTAPGEIRGALASPRFPCDGALCSDVSDFLFHVSSSKSFLLDSFFYAARHPIGWRARALPGVALLIMRSLSPGDWSEEERGHLHRKRPRFT